MSSTHLRLETRFRPLTLESTKQCIDNSVLLGESAAVQRLRMQIRRIAPYLRTALIRGEIGSGKHMVARALHAHSPGAGGPFIIANAGELTASLLAAARGGTLYLCGVDKLSFELQDILFRFLRVRDKQRGISPVIGQRFLSPELSVGGRNRELHQGDTRILASSGRDLRKLSAIGQFRQDLYARLAAVEVFVPPLRQRREDIPMLAAWILRRNAESGEAAPKMLTGATMAQLQDWVWPGNLRELDHVVTQAAALAEGGLIEPCHLRALTEPEVRMESLHNVMMRHVLNVLTGCNGNKVRAAQVLGISRSTLYRMLGAEAATEGCP